MATRSAFEAWGVLITITLRSSNAGDGECVLVPPPSTGESRETALATERGRISVALRLKFRLFESHVR